MTTVARGEALLEGLNEPQREAVLHGEGPLLILAGAGSGKTRVLTHRIAHLVYSGKAKPGEILAITFTNKAAQEMRERVEMLVGNRARAMWVMTFHSACARMLRSHAESLGYTRAFTIYDEQDALRLVKLCIEELHLDSKRHRPRAIRRQISDAKNRLVSASAYRERLRSEFEHAAADVYDLYEQRSRAMNALDFDDLLVRTVQMLELFPEIRQRYQHSFQHVLVDEYQDTNRAQYRWLQILAEEHRNLAVVADDAQSIYSFRGADIRNVLSFQDDFPDARLVKLEQNYRSTQTILSAANAVIAHNRAQLRKELWTESGTGDLITVRGLENEHAEARYVTGEVERLVDAGASRDEVAVFYRANAQSRVLEDALVRREVPYQVIGGTRFYDRAEVKDALAYLTLLVNPHDAVAFRRVVNSPRRGIGDTTQARIANYASSLGVPIWDIAAQPGEIPSLGAAAVKAVGRFMETMQTLKASAENVSSVADLLEDLLRQSGYIDALQAERTFEADGRLENLEELVNVAREYDARADDPTIEEFLQQVALVSDQDNLRDEDGVVTLMTLHNAKGLEYPVVFMIGMEDGVFPHMRSIEAGDLDEERRLCYVGMTRAMRKLYLTHAFERTTYGGRERRAGSTFLEEIPSDLTDREDDRGPPQMAVWGTGRAAPAPRSARESYAVGDRVTHVRYGPGVVTGMQRDAVSVRFSEDGSERDLLDYAPLKKL